MLLCAADARRVIELYQEHALLQEQQLASALHAGQILGERYEQLVRAGLEGAAARQAQSAAANSGINLAAAAFGDCAK